MLDLETGRAGPVVEAPADRRFSGHGVFDAAGRVLYVAEDDVERGEGAVGVYDWSDDGCARLGAFPTHGIGPHEMVLADGGRVLAIANGCVLRPIPTPDGRS